MTTPAVNSGTQTVNTFSPDFPFYNGQPASLSHRHWLILLGSLVIAFALLITLPPTVGFLQLCRALLFAVIPLVTLAWLSGKGPGYLLKPVAGKQIAQMFAFALLNLLVTLSAGLAYAQLATQDPNPVFSLLATMSSSERSLFLLSTIPQLLGEELITILPFLALFSLLTQKIRWSRHIAIAVACIASSILFALLHLPTYNWNLLQCLLLIGSARVVLTLAYIYSKNLSVCFGAHLINDWILFGFAMLTVAVSGNV